MASRLSGTTSLVTGSTSNIGKAIAMRFAAEGSRVVVTGRSADRGEAVVTAIRADGGQAEFVQLDLDGTAAKSRELAEQASAVYGPIDVLVNNAGIFPSGGTLAIEESTFDQIMALNVKAPFFLTAALVPTMAEAGHGVIINLGSWVARLGLAAGTTYASTKGAIETLTRGWSAEFGPAGIRVNAISPGVTLDEGSELRAVAGPMMASTPLGTVIDPVGIADAAVFLASDESRFVHGTVLDVDGGRSSVFAAAR
jgi:NAD(P)-dependent dehydrogenase (short-subunit alcohol dehydrogenase family)